MKHIKEAEGIHKTQSPFFSWPPNSLWGKGRRRKREGGLRFTLIQAVMASPAQLHLGSRPAREGCLLARHRPPPDESGGSQTFTPLERLRPRPCRRHNGRSVLRASSSPPAGMCTCTTEQGATTSRGQWKERRRRHRLQSQTINQAWLFPRFLG